MKFSTLWALGAAATLAAAIGGGADAASTKKPAAKPAAAAPAGAPGSQSVDLLPMGQSWIKQCQKNPQTQKNTCVVTRVFGHAADQPPDLGFALYQTEGVDKDHLQVVLPLQLLLPPGIRIQIDGGESVPGRFLTCAPNGCFAETDLTPAQVGKVKSGKILTVAVRNLASVELDFKLSLDGFATALAGPAIDPAVLKKQQDDLQKKLQDQAKKLQQQQQQAPAGGAAAPAK
ncbi:MAG: invasion associated locus B family protein [Hyphomicrobiales bacterium]|nr:invasion associated locus B family protein [Hyphomicrobiales bacterium]